MKNLTDITHEYCMSLTEMYKDHEFTYISKYGSPVTGTIKDFSVGYDMKSTDYMISIGINKYEWTHIRPVIKIFSNESGHGYEFHKCHIKLTKDGLREGRNDIERKVMEREFKAIEYIAYGLYITGPHDLNVSLHDCVTFEEFVNTHSWSADGDAGEFKWAFEKAWKLYSSRC